jgi:hypothetical protein
VVGFFGKDPRVFCQSCGWPYSSLNRGEIEFHRRWTHERDPGIAGENPLAQSTAAPTGSICGEHSGVRADRHGADGHS